jgi:REP element-mobilizing transposase RayT
MEKPERKPHRLPLESYTSGDVDFFFTINAHQRLDRPFTRHLLAQAIVDALLWRKHHHEWLLFCYCLMPDHLHFIMRLPERDQYYYNAGARGRVSEGVLDQVGEFKRYTTTQVWWKQGGKGMLWHTSSYDHVLRKHESVEAAVRYVVNNPVRKGLVEDWHDYPYTAIVNQW